MIVTPCNDNRQPSSPDGGATLPDWQICVRVPAEALPAPVHPGELTPPRSPAPREFDRFRHGLPTRGHFVYVLTDSDGGALYVGQTGHPRLRIRAHWRSKDWWPDVAEIRLWPVDGELPARLLEDALTRHLRPAHGGVTDLDRVRLHRLAAGVPS